jgi:hypothetical protein
MRRRDFIKVAFGFAAARPFVARADEQRRVGVLMNRAAGDAEGQTAVAAFRQALQELIGAKGAIYRSISAGGRTMSTANADMRPNWLHLRQNLSWLLAPSV